jgi:hypothetical protein
MIEDNFCIETTLVKSIDMLREYQDNVEKLTNY